MCSDAWPLRIWSHAVPGMVIIVFPLIHPIFSVRQRAHLRYNERWHRESSVTCLPCHRNIYVLHIIILSSFATPNIILHYHFRNLKFHFTILQCPYKSLPCIGPYTAVPVFPLSCHWSSRSFFLSHNTPDNLFLFFHPRAMHAVVDFRIQFSILRHRRSQVCKCLHYTACFSLWMDLCVWMFIATQLFSLLSTNLQSSLVHCSSPLFKRLVCSLLVLHMHYCVVCHTWNNQRRPI